MNPCVRRAIGSGKAIAIFLGTSSPKIIVTTVASTRPTATATPETAPSGTPMAVSGVSSRLAMAGSARKPIARLVTVTPTCAPESCVDRCRSAVRTPWACRSPSLAARSTAARSTATKEYSAAPKTPQARTRPTEIASSSHSMAPIVAEPPQHHRRARGTVRGSMSVGGDEEVCAVLRISGVGISDVGRVRGHNEDSAFLGPSCMLVADGVGGAAAGEVASATTAYVVSASVLGQPGVAPAEVLSAAIRLARKQLRLGVRQDPARTGMATTLTAVVTDGERFALAHVGDSRGYVFRDGSLERVTTDHTVVQRLVDQGTLHAEDVSRHPWRHMVLRSLGGDDGEPRRCRRHPQPRPAGR